jgi:hypothetical protein
MLLSPPARDIQWSDRCQACFKGSPPSGESKDLTDIEKQN